MSVTTTENPVTYSLAGTLRDYELHRSQPEDEQTEELNEHPAPANTPSSNPPDWPTDHRRVPPYRPTNTELDHSTRRVYLNNGERAFIQMMFFGLRTNVVRTCKFLRLDHGN
jgi:hypothetical protein